MYRLAMDWLVSLIIVGSVRAPSYLLVIYGTFLFLNRSVSSVTNLVKIMYWWVLNPILTNLFFVRLYFSQTCNGFAIIYLGVEVNIWNDQKYILEIRNFEYLITLHTFWRSNIHHYSSDLLEKILGYSLNIVESVCIVLICW